MTTRLPEGVAAQAVFRAAKARSRKQLKIRLVRVKTANGFISFIWRKRLGTEVNFLTAECAENAECLGREQA
jgi:hypothetical protein